MFTGRSAVFTVASPESGEIGHPFCLGYCSLTTDRFAVQVVHGEVVEVDGNVAVSMVMGALSTNIN